MDGYSAALEGPPRAFELDGDRYALAGGCWAATWPLLPGYEDELWPLLWLQGALEPGSWEALAARCMDVADPLDMPDLARVVQQLLEAGYGRPWWSACRLAAAALSRWDEVDGRLALRGVDLLGLIGREPSRAVNVVYALLIEHADERRRREIDGELERPPPGADPAASWSADAEGSAFMAAMATAPGRALAD